MTPTCSVSLDCPTRDSRARRAPLRAVSLTILMAFALSACAPSVWQQIQTTVEADLKNGVILGAIETAVATLDPALAGVAGAIDSVVQVIIDDLEANGALTPAQVANAETVKSQIKAKLAKLSAVDRATLDGRWSGLAASPQLVQLVSRELSR
jgi:hypothetical protein